MVLMKKLGVPLAHYASKEIIKELIDAGVDCIDLPAPGSRHGISVDMIRELVEYIHSYKPGTLAMTFLNSSVECADPDTIRLIALKMKETGADIHAIGNEKMYNQFRENVVFTLADHIDFAIQRYRKNINIKLPLLYEVRQLYPGESELGRQALDILKKRLKVSLPREEAAAIALHFVNYKAQADTAPDIDYGSLIEQATAIVERELNVTVDRDGFNYYRFVTHMHYMMKRTLDDTMIDSQNRELFESMKKEYPDIYSCAVKVAALIDQKLQKHLSEEEILYLILHINRLCAREDCDR